MLEKHFLNNTFYRLCEVADVFSECRHRLFSTHFGEPAPKCMNRCDICRSKNEVEERVNRFLLSSVQFNTTASTSDTNFSDLYEGGRNGMKE